MEVVIYPVTKRVAEEGKRGVREGEEKHQCPARITMEVENWPPKKAVRCILDGVAATVTSCNECKCFAEHHAGMRVHFEGEYNPQRFGHEGIQL